jgi:ketosteroid isomerase-like protein
VFDLRGERKYARVSRAEGEVSVMSTQTTTAARQRIEQVEGALARWNQGLRPVPAEEIHPELELLTAFGSVTGEVYRGAEGLERWHTDIGENFERFDVAADAFHAIDDDTVVALLTVQLKARESGIEMTQPFGWIVDFTEGRFRRLRTFTSHAEALRAAGIGG